MNLSKLNSQNQELIKKNTFDTNQLSPMSCVSFDRDTSSSKSSDSEPLKENVNCQNNYSKKFYKSSKYPNLLFSNLECNLSIKENEMKIFIKKELKKRTDYWYNCSISKYLDTLTSNNIIFYCTCMNKKNKCTMKCESKLKVIIDKKTKKARIYQNQEPHSHECKS
jgi:hypothetical protein